MTLRTRLLLGLGVTLSVFVAAVTFTVFAQRDHLLDQVDDQLRSTPLPPSGPQPAPAAQPTDPADPPISDLYLASLRPDGSVTVLIEGQRLTDRPVLQSFLEDPPHQPTVRSVDGENGPSRFRVLYIPGRGIGPATVVAVPLDNVDDTVTQLIYTFLVVALLITVVLAVIGFWVNRLGVRPITEMTATADAIAAGDRDRRAESYGETTEAGRLSNALNVMLDQRDEAEDRLRQFVSNASHELRTPLTSIRGYLDLYAEGGFREPGQLDDAVRRMRDESARMNLLVEDLLVLARLDEQQPLDLAPVDIVEMLHDIAASALAAHPDRIVTVTETQALTVSADRLRLQQAVAGLVDNAITHTPPSTAIQLHGAQSEGAVDVIVSDTGPGLSADVAARVFDRFYRGDASRSRVAGGAGLGLSITKSIVEAHDGEITVASAPGEGTAFTVRLPVVP